MQVQESPKGNLELPVLKISGTNSMNRKHRKILSAQAMMAAFLLTPASARETNSSKSEQLATPAVIPKVINIWPGVAPGGGFIFLDTDTHEVAERWRVHYNTMRPHSSLGYGPPAPETWVATSLEFGEVETATHRNEPCSPGTSATRVPLSHTPDCDYRSKQLADGLRYF